MIGQAEKVPSTGLNNVRRAAQELHAFVQDGNGLRAATASDEAFAFAQVPRTGRPGRRFRLQATEMTART